MALKLNLGSPGQAKLLQKQKLSIAASFGINRINSIYTLTSLHGRTTFSPNLGNIKNRPLGPDFSYGSPGQARTDNLEVNSFLLHH